MRKVRDLNLIKAREPGHSLFVSAASGLALLRNHWYIISDDENAIARFPVDDVGPGELIPIFSGVLPHEKTARKKVKPDLESLALIPSFATDGREALLAVPSGSTEHRMRGALITLCNDETLQSQAIDFRPLYEKLIATLGEINIEGIVATRKNIRLFNRGNSINGKNAIIELNRETALRELRTNSQLASFEKLSLFDLGKQAGSPYTFTDACPDLDGDGVIFLAASEATLNSYHDGEYLGAIIGRIDRDLIVWTRTLPCPQKPEGIWAFREGAQAKARIVTDADDPEIPSVMYEVDL